MARLSLRKEKPSDVVTSPKQSRSRFVSSWFIGCVAIWGFLGLNANMGDYSESSVMYSEAGYEQVSPVDIEDIASSPGGLRFDVEEFTEEKQDEEMVFSTAYKGDTPVLVSYLPEENEIYEVSTLDGVSQHYLDMEDRGI